MAVDHRIAIRSLLGTSSRSARELAENLGISQPTVSRALSTLGDDLIRFGPYQSIQYALRRPLLAKASIPVFRVTQEGRLDKLGDLTPVQPHGYVMTEASGKTSLSEGFPWWLHDMWPQGFLGRAMVAAQASGLGLPERLGDWQEEHVLRALLSPFGADAVGNLLLGEWARENFIRQSEPVPIAAPEISAAYAQRAGQAMAGDAPASSAGGEQPKFLAFTESPAGSRHVLVKFTLPGNNPLTRRWRDLLLAEHHALMLLREFGIAAVNTRIVDHGEQRFLEVERFDRIGARGRRGLISLSALDAEFVGLGRGGWPAMTARLADERHITLAAHDGACRLHAFGTLIGNTDMHPGNLSFVADSGRPYELAPAYDMLPMAFAPRSSGELPEAVPPPGIDSKVPPPVWREMEMLAHRYLERLQGESALSPDFFPCLAALRAHLQEGGARIGRLA